MADDLSIVKPVIELHSKAQDRKAAALKALAGAAPVVGSVLTEIVNEVIPNQRLDRIALFAEILDQRLSCVEVDILEAKMRSVEFTDLLEDGFTQAARSTSDDRRGYIASLLARSVTAEDCSHVEQKKLLGLLGELNDLEIIYLSS